MNKDSVKKEQPANIVYTQCRDRLAASTREFWDTIWQVQNLSLLTLQINLQIQMLSNIHTCYKQ